MWNLCPLLFTSLPAIIKRYENGLYDFELRKLMNQARRWIDNYVDEIQENDIIIMDVDDTAISSFPEMKRRDFNSIPPLDLIWTLRKKAPAINEILKFYKYVREKNIGVVFLSERVSQAKENTEENLRDVGYNDFIDLIVHDETNTFEEPQVFKENQRRMMIELGYNIIMTIGDQDCDVDGEYAGAKIKIPNGLYIIE